jgi:carotenoid cleavage dioxygenase-like enzyme
MTSPGFTFDPAKGRASLAVFDARSFGADPVAQAHFSELFGVVSHTANMVKRALAKS